MGRRRNSRLSLMSLTKPSLRCLAIRFSRRFSKPHFQDNCSNSYLSLLHYSFCRIVSNILFSTTLHKLLVTLPALSMPKLLGSFLPNSEGVRSIFFLLTKNALLWKKPSNFVSQKSLQSQYLQ